jgi:dTDP-4-amino-4,6-dideoxygalactose transaminase
VDIERDTYNMDPNRLEEAITPRTRAILAVHQIGLPCSIKEILAIASRHNLPVLEDAAPAIGAEYFGKHIGAPHGVVACFSFDGRKILNTGEGGMITTADDEIAGRLRRLRTQAMSVSNEARHNAKQIIFETYDEVGYNYRLTDIQGAIGIVQITRLPHFLERRRHLASRYTKALQSSGWLIPPAEPEGHFHVYQSYMPRLAPDAPLTRDELMQGLLDRGVSTRRGVMAIHREPPYRNPIWDERLPETNAAADEAVILPLYVDMTDEDQDYVLECLSEVAAAARRR